MGSSSAARSAATRAVGRPAPATPLERRNHASLVRAGSANKRACTPAKTTCLHVPPRGAFFFMFFLPESPRKYRQQVHMPTLRAAPPP